MSTTVIVTEAVPPRLRGRLAIWLLEVNLCIFGRGKNCSI
nr:type I-E CRISPR-associated endoribonuclease Cas2e [Xenorhabdus ishibashii]